MIREKPPQPGLPMGEGLWRFRSILRLNGQPDPMSEAFLQMVGGQSVGAVYDTNAGAVWNGERQGQGETDWEAAGYALFSVSEGGIECQ